MRGWRVLALYVVIVIGAGAARAGGPEAAAAEEAFDRGREQMKAGLYTEACASFDESERLDPQIGTLYNLASCWEKVGKLASAWTAFREVAQRDSNATRRKAADDHAAALKPRMPKLVIKMDAPPPGMTVTLNGGDVTKLLGIETPMDLGTYAIVVTAKGYQGWGAEATIAKEGETVTVTVPKLVPGSGRAPTVVVGTKPRPKPEVKQTPPPKPEVKQTPPPKPVVAAIKPAPEPVESVETSAPSSGHGHLGLFVAGGGGALVIGGLVAGVLARGKLDDAEKICPNKACATMDDQTAANALLAQSRTRGNISTGLVGVGAAAVIAGGVLWFMSSRDDHEAPQTAIAPVAGPSEVGVVVMGQF
jgi:hypothetical protein